MSFPSVLRTVVLKALISVSRIIAIILYVQTVLEGPLAKQFLEKDHLWALPCWLPLLP